MKANRTWGLSILFVRWACVGTMAHASGPFSVTGTTVLTETGQDVVMHRGNNLLDQQTQMDCVSAAGCSVVIQSELFLEGNRKNDRLAKWCIRSFIDGIEAEPKCTQKELSLGPLHTEGLQTLDVAQGSHSVQTALVCPDRFVDVHWKGKLRTWAIIYTMYDH